MSRKLFVGNLPYSVTSERLQEAFSQFGTVSSSKVIVDRETGRSRGFAFLEMETDDQGAAAMQAMNGALLDGRSIAVREAVERQPGRRRRRLRRRGGGGRDGGGFRPRGPRPPYGGGGGGGDAAAAVAALRRRRRWRRLWWRRRWLATAAVAAGRRLSRRALGPAVVLAMAARCATGAPISPAVLRRPAADLTAAAPKSPGRSGVTAAARPTVRDGSVITSRASAGSTTINRP